MDIKVVLLLIAGLLIQATNSTSVDNDDLLHRLCARTEKEELCVKLIEADPRQELKGSPNGFCQILRDNAVMNYVATNNKIPDILNRTTVPFVRAGLRNCSIDYLKTIDIFRSLDFSVISQERYRELAVNVSYGYDTPNSCEDYFREGLPGTSIPSELEYDNGNLANAPIIIADIINLVVCDKIIACS